MRGQSVVSDVESDTEKGSTDGASCLATSAAPESAVDAPTDPTNEPTDTPKPRIPKVTSDSFISELVSDREPGKTTRVVGSASPAVLEEEPIPGEGEVKALCADVVLSPSQSGGPLDLQWSNVDLEEAQSQQAQTAAVLDSADTCSLSSVATYTLAMEDPYGADEHPLWAWVSGGGCSVDSHSQLNWFSCSMNASSELDEVASMFVFPFHVCRKTHQMILMMSVISLSLPPSVSPVGPVHESVCHASPDGSLAETNL